MISSLQISPKHQPTAKLKAASMGVSPFLTESAYLENSEVLDKFKTSLRGLTKTEAEKRLIKHGPNAVALETQRGWLWRLFKASSDGPIPPDLRKFVNLLFLVVLIGFFVFFCFFTPKVAVYLFFPFVLSGFFC